MSRAQVADSRPTGSAKLGRLLAGPDLDVRHREAELMDDPALGRDEHVRALVALRRINRVSLASREVWREVLALHRSGKQAPVRVLDVACGGGDLLVDVGRRARRAGVSVDLAGCDVSRVALAEVARAADGAGLPVQTVQADVVREGIRDEYDLVTASLFMHHLDWTSAVRLLRDMRRATTGTVLVQDLRRTRRGYALAWLGLHTLTRSRIARVDGLRSVRAAFSTTEVRALCDEAELGDATVATRWPQRVSVRWRRP